MLDLLAEYVNRDSPSGDGGSQKALAIRISDRMRAPRRFFAIDRKRIRRTAYLGELRRRGGSRADPHSRALRYRLARGAAGERPFRIEGDKAFGPGVYDMKASLVMAEFALDAVRESGIESRKPIEVLITSDEEIGSPTSRVLIEDRGESPNAFSSSNRRLPRGALKTARKGVGTFTIEVEGKSAHAGVDPAAGTNAIVELSHQVLAVTALVRRGGGTTLSVGSIAGGGPVNVVPAAARAELDVRATTTAEMRRLETELASLTPVLAGAVVRVSGGFHRPPMERTAAIAGLFERVRSLADELGIFLDEGSTGGGSDGNFTAALGVPTLDGLGSPGGGAHALSEFISIPGFLDTHRAFSPLVAQTLMNMGDFEIRPATRPSEYRACRDAQRAAWGIDDDSYIVPIATMAGAAHHGGLVLGAFLASGAAVGVSFAFLGRSQGELCLYSQLTGVVPGRQGQGIGLELKTAQREFARSQGLESIVWAFDPLQAGNAHFNFEKLGVTASVFIADMYGPGPIG